MLVISIKQTPHNLICLWLKSELHVSLRVFAGVVNVYYELLYRLSVLEVELINILNDGAQLVGILLKHLAEICNQILNTEYI